MVDVTVGIKALNEEKHISASLTSALDAVKPWRGEVILADSGSTDGTITEAKKHDLVRIVQLANPDEKNCGVGAQLAFQYAQGRYFYLLDGDMVLNPEFLKAGMEFLDKNPDVAGVGGIVQQANLDGEEYRIRQTTAEQDKSWKAGVVNQLECGGLYRSDVIRELGYFADRNLHSFEEFELGARLRSRGWKLARLDMPAVTHYGHTTGGYRLLWRRLFSGYIDGAGEVFRSSLGKGYILDVLMRLKHIIYGVVTILGWGAVAWLSLRNPLYGLCLLAIAILAICFRRKSFRLGLYSFVTWNVYAIGLVRGFFRKRTPPALPIRAIDIER